MDLKQIGRKKVVTVTRDASLEQAARLMREAHVGDVVVVEHREGRKIPLGILTDRDIVMATLALGASPSALEAGDIMSAPLVTITENTSLIQVIKIMKEKGVKRVPILSENELVGIVALEDLMRLLTSELSALAEVSGRQRTLEQGRRRKLA
jgi:CBS domain-containing protein